MVTQQPTGAWLAAALVFISVAMITTALAILVEWLARRRRERGVATQLHRLSTEALETLSPGAAAILRGTGISEAPWVQLLTGRVPHLRDVQNMLHQAALDWSVRSYMTFAFGSGVAFGLTAYGLTASWIAAAFAAALGASLPYMYVGYRRGKRLARFEEQFPAAVDLLGRAIRAGHPLSAALKMVADEVADPVAGEFRAVFEEQRFGLPFTESLAALADRVPLADVRIFVTAVLIQREVGGNLTEILDNLAEIIRQRFTLKRQVQVLTAEGRYSVYVLTALPIVIAGFVYLTNPTYLKPLWETDIGRMMLYGALAAQVVGYLWMRKLTNIEF
jgi:tight adherence protein B